MPQPYSDDLRWRIVWKHLIKGEDVASIRSVYWYTERFLATGDIKLFAKRNLPMREMSEFEEFFLVQLALLRELQEQLYSKTMHWVDVSTICRAIHCIGMTRQKIKHYALGGSEARRAEFWEEINHFDPSMMVWVDETGCDLRNAMKKYGYGIRGMPPQDYTLKLSGKRYSAVEILTTEGVEDVYMEEGSVNREVFLDFVRKCLLPI